jgi:hypothetical protein
MAGLKMNNENVIRKIKNKAIESEIEFPNLIMNYVICVVYEGLAQSKAEEKVIFFNEPVLRTGIFYKKEDMEILFCTENEENDNLISDLKIFLDEKGIAIKKLKRERNAIGLKLGIDRFEIDVKLKSSSLQNDKIYPVRKEIICKADETERFEIWLYPMEIQVVELLTEIMSKMELINDMDIIFRLNKILTEETLDGLKLSRKIEEKIEKKQMRLSPEKKEKINSYGNYKYLITKWNKYLRVSKRNEPTWEQQYNVFMKFLMPLWDAAYNGEIFIGNWMPELGRYLG